MIALGVDVGTIAERDRIRLLSIGTGSYPVMRREMMRIVKTAVPTFATLLRTGSDTVETLRRVLYADLPRVRIDRATADDRLRTDFVERDVDKLFP